MKGTGSLGRLLIFLWGISGTLPLLAQERVLDDFEATGGWSFIHSDAVKISDASDTGHTGKAIRFDYEFTTGAGYAGIQKKFAIDLPENFEFTFFLRAESPANNFEIKFLDSTGNNVWWVNNRNFEFPTGWTRIRIKKRHVGFAWGPTSDQSLKRIDRIEFTVASYVGGKGRVWIDDLKFIPLPPETQNYPEPLIRTIPSPAGTGQVVVDFKTRREFGGLMIDWLPGQGPGSIKVSLSEDSLHWEEVWSAGRQLDDVSFIRLREAEARYLRLDLTNPGGGQWNGIRDISFLKVGNSLTMNDFLIYIAQKSKAGYYPRSFLGQASYWTINGVNQDIKEVLINEDGMVEVEKGRFSIEPMIRVGDSLYNWNNVKATQQLGSSQSAGQFEFIPTVIWNFSHFELRVSITTTGEPNKNSRLNIRYDLENHSSVPADIELYLLVRPLQVNPYYQWLNLNGGAGRIDRISGESGVIHVDEKTIFSGWPLDTFSAASLSAGRPVAMIEQKRIPAGQSVSDPLRMATGIAKYKRHLEPWEKTGTYLVVPLWESDPADKITVAGAEAESAEMTKFWQEKVGHIRFDLPPSADRIIGAYRANLAYILVNRDRTGIQPGSRSYDRSWIRDGALTSSALLKSGIVPEVREFIDWYAEHQFPNGKVPCVVDARGPDPVPENDSHGQFIYLIREYFNFTGDTAFLRSKNPNVLLAVDYLESLIAQRSTPHYKNGNDSIRAQYGLVPESISHEGYSAKPMHSYWDNFFTIKGLKDAAEIQAILGDKVQYERIIRIRDTFRENLYKSLNLAMKFHGIDYLPGCAELGDFDATSTTIALTPCNELDNLPKPQVYNTFDKYYKYFTDRRDGNINWINYTPYENRLIGSFIMLDQPGKAHELIEFFLNDQRPQGWHHWAEVVWKDYRNPSFIGDMPHTWVGSDFINAIRALFVYENEAEQSLVIGAGLYQDWIDARDGMSVSNLPTYYGELSYGVKKSGNSYKISITGNLHLPSNGIEIRNFNGGKMPARVIVNGKGTKSYQAGRIKVPMIPAEVEIFY
jgi:hypothetical protein